MKIAEVCKTGALKGLRTALRLYRIVLPIYAIVAIVGHTGFYLWLAPMLEPAMRIFALPGEAVVPLIIGAFSDEYSMVASMSALSLSAAQITTAAMISLCFHGIPVELVVSQRIGVPPLRFLLFRLVMAIITGIFVAWLGALFLGGAAPALTPSPDSAMSASITFGELGFDTGWDILLPELGLGVLNMALMLLKVLIPLMIAIEFMFVYRVVNIIAKKLSWLCRLLGISRDALVPLLVGALLGVTYGVGALMELNKKQPLSRKDTILLGVFLFSGHAYIEGTYLFAMAGANIIFICGVRLLIAIAATALIGRVLSARFH